METKARIKLHLLLSFVCFQVENSTFACCRCRRRRCCRRSCRCRRCRRCRCRRCSCRCRRCRRCSRVSLLLLPPLGNLIFDKVDLFSKLPPVSFRSSRKEKKSSHLNQDFFLSGTIRMMKWKKWRTSAGSSFIFTLFSHGSSLARTNRIKANF